MKIIEITGIAGVGKSYILNRLLKNNNSVSDMELIKNTISQIYIWYICFLKLKTLQNYLELYLILQESLICLYWIELIL